MTENEFRITFCKLIEYYQYIEMRLKFICAKFLADEDKEWFDRLNDIDSDPFGMLIHKIRSLQVHKQFDVLSQNDFEELYCLRNSRNYWVHQCFGSLNHVVFHKEELKNMEYGKKLKNDLLVAMNWDEKLTKKTKILNKKEITANTK